MMRLMGAMAAVGILSACGEAADNQAAATPAATQAAAAAPAPAAAGRASIFTPIGDKECKTIEAIEETGDFTAECPAAAGYKLEWSVGDLRDDVTLIKDGRRTSLGIPELVANGAFVSLGEKVEWRGPAGGAPDLLVVRAHVANSEGKSDAGQLAIARLMPEPCLIAVVPPGPGQSDKARAIADGAPGPCINRD